MLAKFTQERNNSFLRSRPYILYLGLLLLLLSPIAALAQNKIPFSLPQQKDLKKIKSAMITTGKGNIYLELFPEKAPWHVANFKYLADQGFYRGKTFHLHYPGYIIQGGAATGDPDSGPGYSLPPEFNSEEHIPGTLGMARRPDIMNRARRSNGSQFHIVLGEAGHMNGAFTIFGRIIKGLDVAESLQKGDQINDIVVYVTR